MKSPVILLLFGTALAVLYLRDTDSVDAPPDTMDGTEMLALVQQMSGTSGTHIENSPEGKEPSAADVPSPRDVALKAVSALFVQHDFKAAQQYIAANAAYRTGPEGSLVTFLERLYIKRPPEAWDAVKLDRVIFFHTENLNSVSKEYQDNMWERIRGRIQDGLGMLVVLRIGEHKVGREISRRPTRIEFMAFVLQVHEGRPRIVYCDDN